MTDRQLERLRILACPKSYVSSLCDPDRAAVRAAIGEIERLKADVGIMSDECDERGLMVLRLKAAVQAHHDQEGDDRCHLDDLKLYHDVLGEGTDPFVGALPPADDMLESCRRYIRRRRCPGPEGVAPLPGDMTIAQLTAEVARLRTELGEWWRAAVALNDAADDDAERAALAWLNSLRTGSSWSHVPESVAELMADQLEVATAGRDATTATINQLRADVLRLEDEARSLAAERDALLAQDADARSAPRLRAEVERLRAEAALSRDIIGHLNDDVASLAYNDVEKLTAEIEQSRAEVARLRAALAGILDMAEDDIGFGRADDGTPWIFRIRDDARAAMIGGNL